MTLQSPNVAHLNVLHQAILVPLSQGDEVFLTPEAVRKILWCIPDPRRPKPYRVASLEQVNRWRWDYDCNETESWDENFEYTASQIMLLFWRRIQHILAQRVGSIDRDNLRFATIDVKTKKEIPGISQIDIGKSYAFVNEIMWRKIEFLFADDIREQGFYFKDTKEPIFIDGKKVIFIAPEMIVYKGINHLNVTLIHAGVQENFCIDQNSWGMMTLVDGEKIQNMATTDIEWTVVVLAEGVSHYLYNPSSSISQLWDTNGVYDMNTGKKRK